MKRTFVPEPEPFRAYAPSGEFEEFDTELAEESEVSRGSATYIRWVQSSLNQVLGMRLAVDGIAGPRTRSAIRSFQQRQGLTVDGIVGPMTEGALLAAGASPPPVTPTSPSVPTVGTQLPTPGPGYYSYKPGTNQYGIAQTIRALQAIGAAWQRANPTGPRIGIGDISLRGGGPMSGHASHQRGVDIDIRLVRNDRQESPTTYQSASYSRPLTQQLVNTIRANGVLTVRYIFFNDSAVTGVSPWPGHDDHLHVRFFEPTTSPEFESSPLSMTGSYRGTVLERLLADASGTPYMPAFRARQLMRRAGLRPEAEISQETPAKVRLFTCSDDDRTKVEGVLSMSVTVDTLKSAVEAAAGDAVSAALKAARDLESSPRSAATIARFCEAFGVTPDFVPPWRPSGASWRDLGGLVAIRLRKAAHILDGGFIKYFCWIRVAYCPECPNASRDPESRFACSSFGKTYRICLGGLFWRAWQDGDTATTATTLLHEALHIYFGRTISDSGRTGNANCYERFVVRANGLTLHPATESSCPAGVCPAPGTTRPTVSLGSKGPAVSELQSRLNAWALRTPGVSLPPLVVDGIFGSKTLAVVRAFQRAMAITIDGIVGPQTWGRLLSLA